MKNPFKRFRTDKTAQPPQPKEETAITEESAVTDIAPEGAAAEEPKDDFTEWRRSQTRGGIERRERNDIFEAYSVYGADSKGQLICRYYHRYPEHERDFDLSYSRALSFDEFNRRLLNELDKGDMKLPDYNYCISMAGQSEDHENPAYEGFSDAEIAALHDFCESMDTLKDKNYIYENGVYRCECESVAGGETLNIRFRKPLIHDAMENEVAGVEREVMGGYDLESIWIMSVYNRIRERCSSCRLTRMTSLWSLNKETVYIILAEGFEGIDGALTVSVGNAEDFLHFGFYSLDFSKK